ncbi:ATP-binding protein [Methylorubrum suomiense]
MLTVADTGDGMSPDVLARAFEPFFTTKPQGKGTGLGLAQVYGTARQLGGAITLRSRHGEGTTASIYLLRGEVVAGADADRTQGRGVATDATRILVVDDDPQVRAVAVTLLEELGYGVVEASGGAEALRLLHGETASTCC